MPAAGRGSGRRLLLLGAGHAHLEVIRRAPELAARGHEVVAVAPDDFWYSGLATGVLGGRYPPELDRVDVAALGGPAVRVVREAAVAIDPGARRVTLASGEALGYDALSLNLGSEPPPIPGAEGVAFPVKPVRRVMELRAELERRFEAAPGRAVRVAVAGGGVTACELAANLAALAARRGGRVRVEVLAAGTAPSGLPPAAAAVVRGGLEARGVRVLEGARVVRVEPGSARLEGGCEAPFDLLVNATGLRPHPLAAATGLPATRAGALRVDARLRSVADPSVFGGGDCVAVEGHELPRVGVYAVRQAPVLLANLGAALDGREPGRRFRPQRRYLWVMNLGDGTGLAARGRLWWRGRAAFWLKDRLDRGFLAKYRPA